MKNKKLPYIKNELMALAQLLARVPMNLSEQLFIQGFLEKLEKSLPSVKETESRGAV